MIDEAMARIAADAFQAEARAGGDWMTAFTTAIKTAIPLRFASFTDDEIAQLDGAIPRGWISDSLGKELDAEIDKRRG